MRTVAPLATTPGAARLRVAAVLRPYFVGMSAPVRERMAALLASPRWPPLETTAPV